MDTSGVLVFWQFHIVEVLTNTRLQGVLGVSHILHTTSLAFDGIDDVVAFAINFGATGMGFPSAVAEYCSRLVKFGAISAVLFRSPSSGETSGPWGAVFLFFLILCVR